MKMEDKNGSTLQHTACVLQKHCTVTVDSEVNGVPFINHAYEESIYQLLQGLGMTQDTATKILHFEVLKQKHVDNCNSIATFQIPICSS